MPSIDGAAGSLGIPRTLNSALITAQTAYHLYSNNVNNEGWAGLCAARQVRQPLVCPSWLAKACIYWASCTAYLENTV